MWSRQVDEQLVKLSDSTCGCRSIYPLGVLVDLQMPGLQVLAQRIHRSFALHGTHANLSIRLFGHGVTITRRLKQIMAAFAPDRPTSIIDPCGAEANVWGWLL